MNCDGSRFSTVLLPGEKKATEEAAVLPYMQRIVYSIDSHNT